MYEKILNFVNFGPAGASDAQGVTEQAQAAPGGGFGSLIFSTSYSCVDVGNVIFTSKKTRKKSIRK